MEVGRKGRDFQNEKVKTREIRVEREQRERRESVEDEDFSKLLKGSSLMNFTKSSSVGGLN